ncbi:unnamed protein product [Musa acuminata var. zebrina]
MCLQVVCQIKDPVVDPRLAVTYSDEALAKSTREKGGEKVLAVDAVFLLPVLWETNSYDPEFKMILGIYSRWEIHRIHRSTSIDGSIRDGDM